MLRMAKNEDIESFYVTRSRLKDIFTAFCRFQHVVSKREKTFVNPINKFAAINASHASHASYSDQSSFKMRPSEFDVSY